MLIRTLSLLLVFWLARLAEAAPADLDPTFGAGGVLTLGLTPSAVAIDDSGRILVAGNLSLRRYDAGGNLDPSFGSGGQVSNTIAGAAIKIDASGRIVIAGYASNGSDYDFAVARFDANGNPDLTFGTGGKVLAPIGTSNDFGTAAAIDSSGRIVVAGSARVGTSDDFAVARFDASGTLDATFGSGGKLINAFSTGHDQLYGVAIDASGRIVVAGTGSQGGGTNAQFVVERYDGTGTADPTFGSGGIVATRIDGQVHACYGRGLVIDASGRIVVAGSSDVTSVVSGLDRHFALARYDGTGNLDPTFGNGGKVVTPIATSATSGNTRVDEGYAIAIDGRGRIVVAGEVYVLTGNFPTRKFAVVRYMDNGTTDGAFGSGGKVITAIGVENFARVVAIDSTDRIVVGGFASLQPGVGALVRYQGGPPGLPPVASFQMSPSPCSVGDVVAFDGSASHDGDVPARCEFAHH